MGQQFSFLFKKVPPPANFDSLDTMSIFNHAVKVIDGKVLDWTAMQGTKKAYLIVNVASY
jgi:hypothetical protein